MIDITALTATVADNADKIEQLHRMVAHQAQRILELENATDQVDNWYQQPARPLTPWGRPWDVV